MFRKRPPSNVVKFRRPKPGNRWTRPEAYGAVPGFAPRGGRSLGARFGAAMTGWRPLGLLVAAITLYMLWRDGWLG